MVLLATVHIDFIVISKNEDLFQSYGVILYDIIEYCSLYCHIKIKDLFQDYTVI